MLNLIKRRIFNRPPTLAGDRFAADIENAMRRHPAGRLTEVADQAEALGHQQQAVGAALRASKTLVGSTGPLPPR